ncbi:hypothetical protein [Fangia hongkongensis]|uniref:hypothetical protein n=1 Tax=Fangia hongkongensis TaxID=270495 RepID=UPI0012B5C7ED|nr:hypothetical protein [Fangia hongkongensis]
MKNKSKPFRLSFDNLLEDADIILGMDTREACYLGGYYGHFVRQRTSACKKQKNRFMLLTHLHMKKGRYHILSINRAGEIKYHDRRLNQYHTEHPINIVKSNYKINLFSPAQVFYMGYLASSHLIEKNNSSIHTSPTHLTLVS